MAGRCDISIILDSKYAGLLSSQLRNFKRKNNYSWEFSCPICGDSTKQTWKARGGFYRHHGSGDGLNFKCFNCGQTASFRAFLKNFDPDLYREYTVEDFLEKKGSKPIAPAPLPVGQGMMFHNLCEKVEPLAAPNILRTLPSINTLPDTHLAKQYLISRKLPQDFFPNLYYCEDFAVLANQLAPDQKKLKSEPRIIIPMLDQNLKLMAVQGRSLPGNDGLRYITIKTDPSNPKAYGMDRVNLIKRIYVVEGPFDSMFLPNCVAACGADIPYTLPADKCYVAFDNERRNHEIIERMLKASSQGYHVCIWPENIAEKDINNMIIAGYTKKKIREIVDTHSYRSIEARLRIHQWRRDK